MNTVTVFGWVCNRVTDIEALDNLGIDIESVQRNNIQIYYCNNVDFQIIVEKDSEGFGIDMLGEPGVEFSTEAYKTIEEAEEDLKKQLITHKKSIEQLLKATE